MSIEHMEEFLRDVDGDTEPAALIAVGSIYDRALETVSSCGYKVTGVYETALELLLSGAKVALQVDDELDPHLYDLLRQYSLRRGIVQVHELRRPAGMAPLLQFDIERSKLLVVVPAENEARNLARYPEFFSLVGLVERL
jgi:hypothetical protein